MTQVVGGELQFPAFRRTRLRRSHHAGVVDQDVQRAGPARDERRHRRLVSQIELLDARRSELFNRRQALQVKAAQYQATVGLIKALGGSWDTAQPAAKVASTAAQPGKL